MKLSRRWILCIEPGTPEGHQRLMELRKFAIEEGLHLIAPCPHENPCLLEEGDWCHSICRLQRSKMHRILKQGDLPYEDEKFSYLIFSKKEEGEKAEVRILRKPLIQKNRIDLRVCTKEKIKNITITKKEKEHYKEIKKKQCGDCIEEKR